MPSATRFHRLIVAMLGLFALAPGLVGATEIRGETASGAKYLLEVPAGWSAGQPLVFYNHGFDSSPPDAPSIPEGFKNFITAKGFAIAASGYSQRDWALFATGQDHLELIAKVRELFGEPGRVYLTGGSLGGLVAMQQAEQEGLGFVSGVYAVCAPLGGSRVWDQALDVRVTYDALCDDVNGGQLPRSSEQPFLLPRSAVNNNRDSTTALAEVAAASARCVGVGINPLLLTDGMRDRRNRLLAANRLSEDFLEINLYYATFGLSDLYFDAGKLNGGQAFENRDVDYGDAGINALVRRVSSDPLSRLRLKRNFTPSGKLASVAKVLTTTTSGDGLVVPEHQSALLGKLDEFRWARAQVREATGSHCGYSEAELYGGFNAMLDWSNDQIAKPDAAKLNQYCQSQNVLGVPGECRYENLQTPAPLSTRIRPRSTGEPTLDARYSGLWYDPSRPGEGYVLELLSEGRALLAWYTYPNPAQIGAQRWIFAEGKVLDNGLVFDSAIMTTGGQFGRQYAAFDVHLLPFGQVSFAFDRCGHGQMQFQGTPEYGSARREVVQLTHLGGNSCDTQPTPAVSQSRFSGAWSGRPYEGLFVNVQGDGRAFITWYTYDLVFSQVWLFGEGRLVGDKIVIDDMLIPEGALFGTAFNPADVQFKRWGKLEMSFRDCNQATVEFNALAAGFSAGQLQFNRVSTPLGVNCSP